MEGEHVGPFNLGNPSEFTMLELAEVSDLFCFHSVITQLPTGCLKMYWVVSDVTKHFSENLLYFGEEHPNKASEDSLKSLCKVKSLKPFTHLMQHKVVICSLL